MYFLCSWSDICAMGGQQEEILVKQLFLLTGLAAASALAGPITIDVRPALAPNGFGSPSYAAWLANAYEALSTGAASAGTPGTPSYYEQRDQFDGRENMVTSFNSWLGQADPAPAFGAAFASELGNRILFGLFINGNGSQFSISQLSFTAVSTDPGNVLGFGFGAGGLQLWRWLLRHSRRRRRRSVQRNRPDHHQRAEHAVGGCLDWAGQRERTVAVRAGASRRCGTGNNCEQYLFQGTIPMPCKISILGSHHERPRHIGWRFAWPFPN